MASAGQGVQVNPSVGSSTTIAPPHINLELHPTHQVFAHSNQSLQLLPQSNDYVSASYPGSLLNRTINFTKTLTGYDMTKRSLRLDAFVKITVSADFGYLPAIPDPPGPYSDDPFVSSYLAPIADGINAVIQKMEVLNDGNRVDFNPTYEQFIYNQTAQTKDQVTHATNFNGREDTLWSDDQFVNSFAHYPNWSTTKPSTTCLTSSPTEAIYLVSYYISDGLFLADGDAEAEASLTQINKLDINITFGNNYHDLWRPTVPMRRKNTDFTVPSLPLTTGVTVEVMNASLHLRTSGIDPKMQTVPMIGWRPFTAIRTLYADIAGPIPSYDPLNATMYPVNYQQNYQITLDSRNSNYIPSQMVITVVPKGRNQGCYGLCGSPFTITGVELTPSNGAKQLQFVGTSTLAEITQKNGAWWPKNITTRTNADNVPSANLPETLSTVLPAAGNFVVLSPGDYTQSRIVTPGEILAHTLTLRVSIAQLSPFLTSSILSLNPADYQLMVILAIPSTLGTQNNTFKLQVGQYLMATVENSRDQFMADPAGVRIVDNTYGVMVRASASSATQAGGSLRSFFNRAKAWASAQFRKAVADPVGTFNKGRELYDKGRDVYNYAQNRFNSGNGMRPPAAKRLRE